MIILLKRLKAGHKAWYNLSLKFKDIFNGIDLFYYIGIHMKRIFFLVFFVASSQCLITSSVAGDQHLNRGQSAFIPAVSLRGSSRGDLTMSASCGELSGPPNSPKDSKSSSRSPRTVAICPLEDFEKSSPLSPCNPRLDPLYHATRGGSSFSDSAELTSQLIPDGVDFPWVQNTAADQASFRSAAANQEWVILENEVESMVATGLRDANAQSKLYRKILRFASKYSDVLVDDGLSSDESRQEEDSFVEYLRVTSLLVRYMGKKA